MNSNKLLQVTTSDGLYLHGFYAPSESKKTGVLFIHGFEGNFYENGFIYAIIREFEEQDIGFLTVNTRGNGGSTNFNTTNGDIKRIGSWYELLEDAHLDITAWLQVLINEGYQEIVLMGHSAGTVKVIRYLFEGEYANKLGKLILLSPLDTKSVMITNGRDNIEELLKKAQTQVEDGKGDELITKEFEDDTMSYRTFISWYQQNDLGRMFEYCNPNYDFPILKQIRIPTLTVIGSQDEYFPNGYQEAINALSKNIANFSGKIIEGAGHCFSGYEENLAIIVRKYILDQPHQ